MDEEWLRFENTGRVEDYLAYKDHMYKQGNFLPKDAKERQENYGSDYHTDRYGSFSNTHWGI